ncbi:hypothetical protein L218DRAFT_942539 [Marasmius fiardii PR-910]|nr:hypothetical protein L218DRAFT_942539 [Marasmius fiardii PR-910]
MFKLTSLVFFIAVAGTALAAPSPRGTQCHPNFGGRAISIVTEAGGAEWGHGTLLEVQRPLAYQTIRNGNGEFRAEFTGDPDSSYYIKASNVPANDMFVSQGPRSNILAWAQGAGPSWSITYESCPYEDVWNFPGGKFATGCTISRSGLCVHESAEVLWAFYHLRRTALMFTDFVMQ